MAQAPERRRLAPAAGTRGGSAQASVSTPPAPRIRTENGPLALGSAWGRLRPNHHPWFLRILQGKPQKKAPDGVREERQFHRQLVPVHGPPHETARGGEGPGRARGGGRRPASPGAPGTGGSGSTAGPEPSEAAPWRSPSPARERVRRAAGWRPAVPAGPTRTSACAPARPEPAARPRPAVCLGRWLGRCDLPPRPSWPPRGGRRA